MEFVNRKACIEHYQEQFPRLPRYMVEMALDYDLSNGGESNEKPLTGKQKRRRKKDLTKQTKRDTSVQDIIQAALKEGKPIEIDCARIIKKGEYVMPPLVKGYVSTEGILEQLEEQEETPGYSPQAVARPSGARVPMPEGEVDDFLIHSAENSAD